MIDVTTAFGVVIYFLAQYIFGSSTMVGLWILLLLFGALSALRIEFVVGVVLLIPITIVMMAEGMIYSVAGGILILIAGIILAMHFFRK